MTLFAFRAAIDRPARQRLGCRAAFWVRAAYCPLHNVWRQRGRRDYATRAPRFAANCDKLDRLSIDISEFENLGNSRHFLCLPPAGLRGDSGDGCDRLERRFRSKLSPFMGDWIK